MARSQLLEKSGGRMRDMAWWEIKVPSQTVQEKGSCPT